MKAKVVPFRMTEQHAKRMLAEIAASSISVVFTDHARKQMRKRRITLPQVVSCLKKGKITEAPVLDHYGNWKVTVERYACGENVGCGVAIDTSSPKAIIITAFWVK